MLKNVIPYKGTNLAPGSRAFELYRGAKNSEDWKVLDSHLRDVAKAEQQRSGM